VSRANRVDIIDLTGQRFGQLSVISRAQSKNGARWNCRCDCGAKKIIQGGHLRHGSARSCGCRKPALIGQANSTHGETRTRIYKIWIGMKSRCYDEKHQAYAIYGGRGILICDAWRNDFPAFRTWALANGYAAYLTIDRRDNNKGYEPGNCRWATWKEQRANQRRVAERCN
jgi:hypothetical protein